ncbi:hypothetical protein [Bradyrhizobium sp. ARR65]|uniref:hypothetical protein n=1 Tax=Bradyrhizobium sp. ARR65 TaxID=1040989 RepID=UPI000465CE01|nr:hypothetical protein [Bradyrhizobium sp. ARR65]
MTSAVPKLQTAEAFGLDPFREDVARGMRDLFRPLDDLLTSGGDPRLALDPVSRRNQYGCGAGPAPEIWNFASSTASPISERAYGRAGGAREALMRSAIEIGLEAAYDVRMEEIRARLKVLLRLPAREVDVVFAPSGTDAQLQALSVARARLGASLTTVVVGSDQTGSGTAFTARGRHFGAVTAVGRAVRKDMPIAGLACEAIALPLLAGALGPRADIDIAVLEAIAAATAGGGSVLLQIMDSSKLGWRAPSEACLAEIGRRWPDKVQIVVDACQMRLGRGRIKTYLDRGYMVLITGSKFFGGPAFSGALLLPAAVLRLLARNPKVASGLLDYTSRSDWPRSLMALRNRLESRSNLGQWLRWEAALDEMAAYYSIPDAFRLHAIKELRSGIEDLIMLSPALGAIGRSVQATMTDDEEFAEPTIFPFLVKGKRGALSADQSRRLHRALARDMSAMTRLSTADREIAARHCLLGQPVELAEQPVAVLRLCVGARLIIEAWSPDPATARRNIERTLDRIAEVVAKIELLLAHPASAKLVESSHGA